MSCFPESTYAIYADGDSTWVLIADGATARRRELVLGIDDGMIAEVREGLTGSERVIVGRPIGLGDGDSIRYGEE